MKTIGTSNYYYSIIRSISLFLFIINIIIFASVVRTIFFDPRHPTYRQNNVSFLVLLNNPTVYSNLNLDSIKNLNSIYLKIEIITLLDYQKIFIAKKKKKNPRNFAYLWTLNGVNQQHTHVPFSFLFVYYKKKIFTIIRFLPLIFLRNKIT